MLQKSFWCKKCPKFPRPFHVSTLLSENFSQVLMRREILNLCKARFSTYVRIEGKFELE